MSFTTQPLPVECSTATSSIWSLHHTQRITLPVCASCFARAHAVSLARAAVPSKHKWLKKHKQPCTYHLICLTHISANNLHLNLPQTCSLRFCTLHDSASQHACYPTVSTSAEPPCCLRCSHARITSSHTCRCMCMCTCQAARSLRSTAAAAHVSPKPAYCLFK